MQDRFVRSGFSLTPYVSWVDVARFGGSVTYPGWAWDEEGYAYVAKLSTDVPDAVGFLKMDQATDTAQSMSFLGPRGAPTSVVVQYRETGTSPWTTGPSVPLTDMVTATYSITGLTAGVQYDYQAIARNANGAGPPSPLVSKFAITPSSTIGNLPTGTIYVGNIITGITIAFAGLPRVYVAAYQGGAAITPRTALTANGVLPPFTSSNPGAVTIQTFSTASILTPITTSASFTFSPILISDGPYTFDAPSIVRQGNYRLDMYATIRRNGVAVNTVNTPGFVLYFGISTSAGVAPIPGSTHVVAASNNGDSWGASTYFDYAPGGQIWALTSDGFAHPYAGYANV